MHLVRTNFDWRSQKLVHIVGLKLKFVYNVCWQSCSLACIYPAKGGPSVCQSVQGKQGITELGANTVSKQTNEQFFKRQKLPYPTVIDLSKWLGLFGLA